MAASPLSEQWMALTARVVAEYRAAIGDDLVAIALFGAGRELVLGSQAGLAARRGGRPVTNGERSSRLAREARQIASEMARALDDEAWNLATRRAQEALEVMLKALLNEMGVDYPKPHDPAPGFVQALRVRRIDVDAPVLDSLTTVSQELAQIRGPAFYQETVVSEDQARDWVRRVEQVLEFAETLLGRLRRSP